jgi:hypothetical protein
MQAPPASRRPSDAYFGERLGHHLVRVDSLSFRARACARSAASSLGFGAPRSGARQYHSSKSSSFSSGTAPIIL